MPRTQSTRNSNRPSVLTSALVSLAVVAGPLLATPVVIHGANPLDFSVSLGRTLWLPAPLAVICAALLVIVLSWSGRLYNRAAALCLAVAWLFWLQGHLLVRDYGVLDGRAIDWLGQWQRGVGDGLLWAAVIALALVFADRLRPRLALLASALLGIYAVTATGMLLSRDTPPAFHHFGLDETHKFDFSRDRNVILLVLDAFQSDVMQQLLDQRPELAEMFDGFTFYRNAAAAYAKTYPSVPLMLTGQWYDNAIPIEAFVEQAFETQSVTGTMLENGWRVDLFPAIPRVVQHSDRVTSNLVPRGNFVETAAESGRLLDLSLFRVTPHLLKAWWVNDNLWRAGPALADWAKRFGDKSNNDRVWHRNAAARFALNVEQRGRIAWSEPAFKFYHLMVPHEPFLLHEDFTVGPMPPGREGFVRHSAAALRVVEKLLQRLKDDGVYEQATVLIVADHGGGDYDAGVRAGDILPADGTPMAAGDGIPPQHHASALPLVLVKYAGDRGPLEVSDTPVSIADVASSIAWSAGLSDRRSGNAAAARRIGGKPAGRIEPRRYYFYRHQGWHGDYLPAMTEYRLQGHSWDPAAWNATGRIIPPGGESIRAARYRWGERVEFTGDAASGAWLYSGWSGSPDAGTWSNAATAWLRVPLEQPAGAARAANAEVRFEFFPFLAGGDIDAQTVALSVNDQPVVDWRVAMNGCYVAQLPETAVRNQPELLFRFDLPAAAAPGKHSSSKDFRKLGVRLKSMAVGPPVSYSLGRSLTFPTQDGTGCALRMMGWSGWPDVAWSIAREAELVFRLDPAELSPDAGLMLQLELQPFLGKGALASQTVVVDDGGGTIATWSVDAAADYNLRLDPPPDGQNEISVRFRFPDAVSPASLGISGDRRELGVMVKRLTLRSD